MTMQHISEIMPAVLESYGISTEPQVEYRNVPGWEDYRVGNDGSVWSFHSGSWKKLKQQEDKDGYLQVHLYNSGKRIAPKVHRLVLSCFVGLPECGKEGCHKDGNPKNNNLDNLYWGTSIENHNDKRVRGTILCGDLHPRARLTEKQIERICVLRNNGSKLQDIADLFSCSSSTVWRILKGIQRVK